MKFSVLLLSEHCFHDLMKSDDYRRKIFGTFACANENTFPEERKIIKMVVHHKEEKNKLMCGDDLSIFRTYFIKQGLTLTLKKKCK